MKRLLLFAALIAWSGMASAVVYKWLDAQGKIQYGDNPPDGVHAEVVELLGTHASRQAANTPTNAPAKPAASTSAAAGDKSGGDTAAKKEVAEDVAATRDKQCADARERYKKLIEGRRLYKTGPDGEREYLNSEEIDKERLDAKNDVDAICNSTT